MGAGDLRCISVHITPDRQAAGAQPLLERLAAAVETALQSETVDNTKAVTISTIVKSVHGTGCLAVFIEGA